MAQPIEQRVAPRPVKAGTLDLTASRQFIDDAHWHSHQEGIVKKHSWWQVDLWFQWGWASPPCNNDFRNPSPVIEDRPQFLAFESGTHTRCLAKYDSSIDQFAKCWHAFKWKPSVWVHRMVAHSGYYNRKHCSLYYFSSIPCKHRHQGFKRDLRHCFQGWKLLRPSLRVKGVRHVVELDSID